MDLGDLIFFGIFIIIVASNIFKQVKKSKKAPDTPPVKAKTGWKKILEDIINDARAQMEQNAEPASGKPGRPPLSWEDLILAEPEEKPLPHTVGKPKADVKMQPVSVSEASGREADFDELRGKGPEILDGDWDRVDFKDNPPPRIKKRPLPEHPETVLLSQASLNDDDLKNAVIWHEILSPPLGLRNL
ncbi:MAG: hypothetical protein MUE70_03230 [Desulfobacterales bacterium]|jgi:hypothetical protein|nr:hypothetical protein [Desulfobacterales bacterium]